MSFQVVIPIVLIPVLISTFFLKLPKNKNNPGKIHKFFKQSHNINDELINIIQKWFINSCQQQYISRKTISLLITPLTYQQTINILNQVSKIDKSFTPQYIVSDNFYRCLFIITENKYIIPIRPSSHNEIMKIKIIQLNNLHK